MNEHDDEHDQEEPGTGELQELSERCDDAWTHRSGGRLIGMSAALRDTLSAWLKLLRYCEEQTADLFIDSHAGFFELIVSCENGQVVARGNVLAPLAAQALAKFEEQEKQFLDSLYPAEPDQ